MANWQFDLLFLPEGAAAPGSDNATGSVPLLPDALVLRAHRFLSASLGPPWQMCKGVLVFGDEGGNRVELVFDPDSDDEAELSARIDARAESAGFCELLGALASELDCSLFSPELGRAIDASGEALVAALMRSDAWSYALDSAEAIRSRSPGNGQA